MTATGTMAGCLPTILRGVAVDVLWRAVADLFYAEGRRIGMGASDIGVLTGAFGLQVRSVIPAPPGAAMEQLGAPTRDMIQSGAQAHTHLDPVAAKSLAVGALICLVGPVWPRYGHREVWCAAESMGYRRPVFSSFSKGAAFHGRGPLARWIQAHHQWIIPFLLSLFDCGLSRRRPVGG